MQLLLWGVSLLGATWILAWHLGTQAAIADAVLMTLACLGVLFIYSILRMNEDRPNSSDR